jgi:beta-mannosidase
MGGNSPGLPDGRDLLDGAEWRCVSAPPGSRTGPDDLVGTELQWLSATVPGTVAHALRAVGAFEPSLERMDARDWWFRCRFTGAPAPGPGTGDGWVLELDGLATLADVWLNGSHILRSESMFADWRLPVSAVSDDNELCLRFAALTPVLEERRARPRWKSKGMSSQNLRWIRTTLLGRQSGWASVPVPVGPWRPVRLRQRAPVEMVRRRVRASCTDTSDVSSTGTVTVELELAGPALSGSEAPAARLEVAGATAILDAVRTSLGWRVAGKVAVEGVERWWPHTHGAQPLYSVQAVVAGIALDLGEVGFRSVTVDRSDDGFQMMVNGVPVFCRGAGWYPIDPVSLQATDAELVASVELTRAAGCNMLRIPGGTVYEDDRFFTACDRAGILVWQDAMLGPLDPPEDDGFIASVVDEVSALLDRVAPHPSLAVLCGGQEIEEQPAMFGLPRERWRSTVIDTALPDLVDREAPGLVYVTSSPSGGDLPFQSSAGVSHYAGVGVYLFPLGDMRRAAPRFVSEGLAFSIPPERITVDEEFSGGLSAHQEAEWKLAVHRDAGSWFDLEDVRDHYTNSMFGADMATLWRTDHERALDLGRAAMTEVVATAIAEWRRAGSSCEGILAIAWRDLRPGPGWGLVDSSGRPKAPWYALARGSAPIAVLATDEGVNGLDLHLVNDSVEDITATLVVGLHTAAHEVEKASRPVLVPAREGVTVRADSLFDGFRDLTYAYCFGPRSYEVVTADLVDGAGGLLSRTAYLPGGPAREIDPDVGLQAVVEPTDGGAWHLRVSCLRFSQYVQIDVPGFLPSDSWFHLPPGGTRAVRLVPEPGPGREPRGRVRALNSGVQGIVAP